MDRLDAMAVLMAVVEEGSLSAAARRLRAPLPTVSRKMADLERYLRTRLLVRTSRRVELTDAGRAYVAATKRILEQVEEAERQAAGEYSAPRGELHVTAPTMLGQRHLLPVALDFLAEQPDITLRLMLVDRQVSLADDHIDVALRIGHLADSELVAARHCPARGNERPRRDHAGHPWARGRVGRFRPCAYPGPRGETNHAVIFEKA